MFMIMCKNQEVCSINTADGSVEIKKPELMPFNLFLQQDADSLAKRVANLNAFNEWCAGRVLSIDRRHAKKILNELKLTQSQTIKDKADISKSYRAVSLQDAFWLKKQEEQVAWKDVNLFSNSFSSAFFSVALQGSSATIKNISLKDVSHELSTHGTYPKAWTRLNGKIVLFKADDTQKDESLRETKASSLLDCFDVPHVKYYLDEYDGERVSVCTCMTDEDWAIVPFKDFKAWCTNRNINPIETVKSIDLYGYYKMNLMTYLIGNIDNHDGNWGFYRNNNTGKLGCIHPLFDFNCAFEGYSLADGGWHLPEEQRIEDPDDPMDYLISNTKTQKEAAIEALKFITIKQIKPVTINEFLSENDFHIFKQRCKDLGLDIVYEGDKNLDQKISEIERKIEYDNKGKRKDFMNSKGDLQL